MKSFCSKKLRGKIFSLLTKIIQPTETSPVTSLRPHEKCLSFFSLRHVEFGWFMPRLAMDESHSDFWPSSSPCLVSWRRKPKMLVQSWLCPGVWAHGGRWLGSLGVDSWASFFF